MKLPPKPARALRNIGLSAMMAFAAATAQAAIVSHNFAVTIDDNGTSVAGQTFFGSFSFDDSTGGPGFGTETLFPLTNFSFGFNGTSYGLADLAYGDAAYDGGLYIGLDAADTGGLFSFLPAAAGLPPSFAYDFGNADAGFGSQQLPEPGTAALTLAALGLLAWHRRKAGAKDDNKACSTH